MRTIVFVAACLFASSARAQPASTPPPDVAASPAPSPAPSPAAETPAGAGDAVWTPSTAGKAMAVFDPVGIGVDPVQCAAIGDLLRSELSRAGVAVIPRSRMPAGECGDEVCATERAAALLANEAVVTKISRLEKKILVIATLYEVPSGKTAFTDRMTAASLDDFDVLAVRIARGLARRIPFAETVDVESVSAHDARDPTRQKSFLTTGLRLGGIVPFGGSYAGTVGLYSGEVTSLFEVRAVTMEAAFGVRANSQYSSEDDTRVVETTLDLGAYYHFSKDDISPFAGAGLGLHNMTGEYTQREYETIDGDRVLVEDRVRVNETGPALWVGGGATLFRAADVHMVLSARWTMTLVEFLDQPAYGVMVGVGVTYTRKSTYCCLW